MVETVSSVLTCLSNLPPFPKVAAKLMTLIDDPLVSTDELSEVLSMDPALVMKVIHASNSPFYMLSKPVETVNQAVLVLGVDTIKTLTTSTVVIDSISKITPRVDVFDINEFWKHSYATAMAATKIAKLESNPHRNRLYLVGLIHDIGKLIIAYYWPESWQRIMNHLRMGEKSYDEIESELFMTSNTELTITLCKNWQFPDYTIELIKQKLILEGPEPDYKNDYKILQNANALASLNNCQFPVEKSDLYSEFDLSKYSHIGESLRSDVENQLKLLL